MAWQYFTEQHPGRACFIKPCLHGVTGETRILDNQSHNLVFYQLNYGHMERVMGVEPTSSAWKADIIADILHPQISPTKQ